MKLSHVIAKYLVEKGVKTIFGYQGGSITHMIDSFDKFGIKYIQSYNEQGAGLAADAYARVSDIGIGVAIGTNGPGATNLITAIANAYCDSVPVLFFTGQVHTYAMKKSDDIRQESFQEIDILPMVKPITKYAVTIMDGNDTIREIDKAIKIAMEGRKGPVVVDIPVDIQGADVEEDIVLSFEDRCSYKECDVSVGTDLNSIKFVADKVLGAKRPLMIVGGGIRSAKAVKIFREVNNLLSIPVVSSLMGLDVLPHDDNNYVGFLGSYGNRYANIAVQNADVIFAIGTRLDMRQTGKRKDLFAKDAYIIHIDIDDNELGHFIKENYTIKTDISIWLRHMNEYLLDNTCRMIPKWDDWKKQIEGWKSMHPSYLEFDSTKETNPNEYMKRIGEALPDGTIVTLDVGQNQMWAAQSLRIKGNNIRILSSGGLGAMGYSLPAAIGAYFSDSFKNVVALMGDGGLQMNIQELQMIAYYKLPIKVIVFKNNSLGLIRDIHEKYYNENYVGSVDGFSVPPLDKLATTYQMNYSIISNESSCDKLYSVFRDDKSWLIEIDIKGKTYTRPELLGSDALDNQIPYIDKE